MKAGFFAVVILLTLTSCASTQPVLDDGGHFHRYPACVERMIGGRMLHDPGWVVAERDAETGAHFFAFLSTYWGRIVEVTRVNRFCAAVRSRFDLGADQPRMIPASDNR